MRPSSRFQYRDSLFRDGCSKKFRNDFRIILSDSLGFYSKILGETCQTPRDMSHTSIRATMQHVNVLNGIMVIQIRSSGHRRRQQTLQKSI